MDLDEKINQIMEKIKDHEKRIKKLEKLEKKEPSKTVTKKETISDHFNYLKSEGFFDEPRFIKEIVERLAQEGHHYNPQSLTYELQKSVQKRILGRIKKDKKWAYCKR